MYLLDELMKDDAINGCIYGCQSDLPNVERSQVSCEFGYPPQGLVGEGVDVGEGHELQAAGRNEIMSAY